MTVSNTDAETMRKWLTCRQLLATPLAVFSCRHQKVSQSQTPCQHYPLVPTKQVIFYKHYETLFPYFLNNIPRYAFPWNSWRDTIHPRVRTGWRHPCYSSFWRSVLHPNIFLTVFKLMVGIDCNFYLWDFFHAASTSGPSRLGIFNSVVFELNTTFPTFPFLFPFLWGWSDSTSSS